MFKNKKILKLFIFYGITALFLLFNAGIFETRVKDEKALLDKVPRTIGEWTSIDLADDKAMEVFLVNDPEGFRPLIRMYRREGVPYSILLSSIEDTKGYQREVHDPRFCYEAQGWTVNTFEDINLNVKGKVIPGMKRLTYNKRASAVKRMEFFGYLTGGEAITSELGLRLIQLKHRMKRLMGMGREHVIYISISADLETKTDPEKDIRMIMEAILAYLV